MEWGFINATLRLCILWKIGDSLYSSLPWECRELGLGLSGIGKRGAEKGHRVEEKTVRA
jgi:hypothetical protein